MTNPRQRAWEAAEFAGNALIHLADTLGKLLELDENTKHWLTKLEGQFAGELSNQEAAERDVGAHVEQVRDELARACRAASYARELMLDAWRALPEDDRQPEPSKPLEAAGCSVS